MKHWFVYLVWIVAVPLQAQTVKPGYFMFSLNVGNYPLTGLSTYPVAKFPYASASASNPIKQQYADSVSVGSSPSKMIGSLGMEFGKSNGIFSSSMFGLTENSSSRTTYWMTSIGYNFPTKIKGLVLQPSVGISQVRMWMQPSDIPLHGSVSMVGTSFSRSSSSSNCGCSADHVDVDIKNFSTFARVKMAIKYNVTPHIAFSVGATFSPFLSSKSLLVLSTGGDGGVKREGFTKTSQAGQTDDKIRNAAMPVSAEGSFLFSFKTSGRSSGRSHHPLRFHHVHYSGCGH